MLFLFVLFLFVIFDVLLILTGKFSVSHRSDNPDHLLRELLFSVFPSVLSKGVPYLPSDTVCPVLHTYPVPVCDMAEDGSYLLPGSVSANLAIPWISSTVSLNCGDHRHPYHQAGLSWTVPSFWHFPAFSSLDRPVNILMFFSIRMLDIHQIQYPDREGYSSGSSPISHMPYSLWLCGIPLSFAARRSGSCKFRLAETFSSGKSHPSSGAVIIRSVFLHFLDASLPTVTSRADDLLLPPEPSWSGSAYS